ncbi:hypothetical protein [Nostoc sp.]
MRPPAIEPLDRTVGINLTARQYEELHRRVLAQKEKKTIARYIRETLGLEQPKTNANAQALEPQSTESSQA